MEKKHKVKQDIGRDGYSTLEVIVNWPGYDEEQEQDELALLRAEISTIATIL